MNKKTIGLAMFIALCAALATGLGIEATQSVYATTANEEGGIDFESVEDATSFLNEWADFANGCSNEMTTQDTSTVISECMDVIQTFNQHMNQLEAQHGETIEKYADEAGYTGALGTGLYNYNSNPSIGGYLN
jgi:hypothetical protein